MGLALAVGAARLAQADRVGFDSWVGHARDAIQDMGLTDHGAHDGFNQVLDLVASGERDKWLKDLHECIAGGMFALTELYSEFIGSRQRAATGRAHRLHSKIDGDELRLATQYFTPGDLGHAIVSQTIDGAIGDSSPSCLSLLVDPACGTGNLLLVALHELTHRWEAQGLETSKAVVAAAQRIRGYDLDRTVARICQLALEIEARVLGGSEAATDFQIDWGGDDDSLGFLRAGLPLVSEIETVRGKVALVTNPPFLGRRLMSRQVKSFLSCHFPLAGNELCAAFVQRSVDVMRTGDAAGFVSQTAWMHLSSYESLRHELMRRAGIHWFCEIGTGAFDRLSGEKARVALITLVKGAADVQGHMLDLAESAGDDRSERLWSPQAFGKPAPSPDAIRRFPRMRLVLNIDDRLTKAFAEMPRYGDIATPLQGTSTGDNEHFVRPWWTSELWSEEWTLASKGGAHARWAGHDHHLVRWGVDGDGLTAKGAALRNTTKIEDTEIVYSDMSSGGLNARRRREGQVFIAGGPGIRVDEGQTYAHLAFLNSRLASAFVQILSPKLVTTPGVLAEIPCPTEVVDDGELATLGREAWSAKEQRIRSSMPAPKWIAELPLIEDLIDSSHACFVRDLEQELVLFHAEQRIDSRLAEYFGIEPAELHKLTRERRAPDIDIADTEALDQRVANMLGPTCVFKGDRAGRGYSAGGVIDSLVRASGAPAAIVAEALLESWDHLDMTRHLYLEDALHTRVLGSVWREGGELGIDEVVSLLSDLARSLPFALSWWLRKRLPERQAIIFPGLDMPMDAVVVPDPPKPIRLGFGF